MDLKIKNNDFYINENLKFIIIDELLIKDKKLLSKKMSKYGGNKNLLLTKNNFLKEDDFFEIYKIDSFSKDKLKEFKENKVEGNNNLNIFFDFSSSISGIKKNIKDIVDLNFAHLKKTNTKFNRKNRIFFIFSISTFSKQNNFYEIDFYNNFFEKVLKSSNDLVFKTYKPQKYENNYINDNYIVNVSKNYDYKNKRWISSNVNKIFLDNYRIWIKNNFIDLRSNFINCFLSINENSKNWKYNELLNEINNIQSLNPSETKIIKIQKNNYNLFKANLEIEELIIIFVEGPDDQKFFEQLIKSFPKIEFAIFPIANSRFSDYIKYQIKNLNKHFKKIYVLGIFDKDEEGKKYIKKYCESKEDLENIYFKDPIDYSFFLQNENENNEVKLENLLQIINSNGKDKINNDEIKKDKALKQYLYNENTSIFKDLTKFIKKDFFQKWVKYIKNIEIESLENK